MLGAVTVSRLFEVLFPEQHGRFVTQVLVVVAFATAYVLIATERIHRVAAALSGAAAMVVLGVVDAQVAFFSERTGVDWNVIFLLLGMMIIVGVLRQTGVFEYLAIVTAKRARGRPFVIMASLMVLTAVASALLDNVTTVLLVAPVTLLVCDQIDAAPVPFLIAEAMASNIGGTATLVGDPPNIIIASRSGLTFNDFLLNLAPIVVRPARGHHRAVPLDVPARARRRHPPASTRSWGSTSARPSPTHACWSSPWWSSPRSWWPSSATRSWASSPPWSPCWGRAPSSPSPGSNRRSTSARWSGRRSSSSPACSSWSAGSSRPASSRRWPKRATEAIGQQYFLASSVILLASGALSGIVDNIPYVATMAPLVQDLVQAGHGAPQADAAWWSLALGADLGGNATAVGASANVVVIGIAARNGHPISFWTFTKYGLVVATTTIVVAWVYVGVRYFVLG